MGQSPWRALAFATSIGLTVALLVAAGVVGGMWLDKVWGTSPLWTVIGLLLGLGIGGWILVKRALGLSRDQDGK